MRKTLLLFSVIVFIQTVSAQNLVVNPDAESLPRGTGWTIVNQGGLTCLLVPTNNTTNWTMKPDGSLNYPFDHTIGASGGTVFFSGCSSIFQGPFELYQVIDVSADAASIDIGTQLYDFSGYIQTPVPIQTDIGRFIVDFLDASNAVLGTSYKSTWQSNFDGSGITWNQYSSTRTAPVGTRSIKIRLQTQMYVNQPAINVHFDDISLTKTIVVPLGLLSFTGKEINSNIQLNWQMANKIECEKFELQRSTNATNFSSIATIQANKINYQFIDENNPHDAGKYFYRLKMTGHNQKIDYSKVVMIKAEKKFSITLTPNPADNIVTVNSLSKPGIVSIINNNGSTMLRTNVKGSSVTLDISRLAAGLYIVRYTSEGNSSNKKLIVQH
jgi:hypothetical protein